MKGLLCAVLGHRRARLAGCKEPLISISTPESGLDLRVDFCDRCGTLWGNIRPTGYGTVEAVRLLSCREG